MKPLREALKKISEKSKPDLLKKLGAAKFSEKSLVAELQSPAAMNSLLADLRENELLLLKAVYQSEDGITLSDAAGLIAIDVPAVAEMARNLSGRLLIYIMKNRQHLNMRLDKIFGIEEIAPFLNLVDRASILAHLSSISASLRNEGPVQRLKISAKDRAAALYLAGHGFMAALEDFVAAFPKDAVFLLASLHRKGIIQIFHCIGDTLVTYIGVAGKQVSACGGLLVQENALKKIKAGNRCFFLLNILKAYDIISSSGLFVTKQNEFRKADLKRISDAMLETVDSSGRKIPKDETAGLCLFFLNRAGCLDILKDAATISLKDIQNEIARPHTLAVKILKSLGLKTGDTHLFPAPFSIFEEKIIASTLKTIKERENRPLVLMKILILAEILALKDASSVEAAIRESGSIAVKIEKGLDLLCILGALRVEQGAMSLTDTGNLVASHPLRQGQDKIAPSQENCVFVNPDYTVALTEGDMATDDLYQILAFCEIDRIDVMVNARITKASVTSALKRGMIPEHFIDTLRNLSKNGIPQNLEFQINDWFIKTIKIDVSQPVLLKASDPLFLDELGFGDFSEGVIERISPCYAVIRKEFLDNIVEFARKRDCLISLFSDIE